MGYSIRSLADKIEASVSGPTALRYMADRLMSESVNRNMFTRIEAARMAAELRRRANAQEGR
jgi:hypothetical protein